MKVIIADFPDFPGAKLLTSARWKNEEKGFLKAMVSFLYDAGEFAAEWEPEYGPITIWHKCAKDAPGADEHYYYEYQDRGPGNWSQLAVEDEHLKQAFIENNYKHIFNVLKKWAESR